jgi:hypothetical protein
MICNVREDQSMRKFILAATAVAAFLSIGAPADRAAAMPVASPAALGAVAADVNPVQQVRWVRYHHRYWRWHHRRYWHPYHYWGWRHYYWGPYYYRPYWHPWRPWWGWRYHYWYW